PALSKTRQNQSHNTTRSKRRSRYQTQQYQTPKHRVAQQPQYRQPQQPVAQQQ
ncbi:hypothetical protein, partial [Escherichia coli]|uniref:hypothetical protein n=1 Tax=Escherichia coli TaxID=562 RepID=UPI002023FC42